MDMLDFFLIIDFLKMLLEEGINRSKWSKGTFKDKETNDRTVEFVWFQ